MAFETDSKLPHGISNLALVWRTQCRYGWFAGGSVPFWVSLWNYQCPKLIPRANLEMPIPMPPWRLVISPRGELTNLA